MAQIPTGNFGQAVAQPTGTASVPRMDVSSGLQNLASTVGTIWQDQQKQANSARAALAIATSDNALHDAHDDVARGVLDGSIPTEQANAEFQKRTDAIASTSTDGLDQEHAAFVKARITGTTGEMQRSLTGVVFKRKQSETAATIDETGEQLQRDASRRGPAAVSESYNAVVDFTGEAAGWTPEQIAAKKRQFSERATWSYFDDKGTRQLAAGDLPGLTDTLHEVMGPGGDAMDPVKRSQVTHQILGFQNHLLAKIDAAQNAADRDKAAREHAGYDKYSEAFDLLANGKNLSPDYITAVSKATAGTSYEKPAAFILGSQGQVAKFATLPADQRAATLEAMRRPGATPGVGTDADHEKLIRLYEKIDGSIKTEIQDNPWEAAQKRGVIPAAPNLVPSDVNSSIQVMGLRMSQIGQVESWVGHKVSPLQPAEADGMVKMIRALPPDQQGAALASIGGVIKDPDRIAAFAKQLGDKNGDMALAMSFAGQNTSQGRTVAGMLLAGSQALRDDTAMVDKAKDTGWKATIAKQVRGAYATPEVEDKVIEAAYLITAGQYAQSGGSVDIDKAVTFASGGIITHGLAGGKIPLPYITGMNKDEFEKRIAAIKPESLKDQAPDGLAHAGKTAMSLETLTRSLPDATLVHAGPGLYNVRTGNYLVTNSAGKRITIKVTP